MKAKFVNYNGKKEIFLENGTSYMANEKETQDKFTKRVKEEASLDVGDLEISELDVQAIKSLDLDKLKKAKPTSKGLVLEIISDQIKKLSAEPKAEKIAKSKAEKVAKPKAEKVAKPKAEKVAKPKAEKIAKPKAEKVAKPKAERLTFEEAQELLEASKEYIGRSCSYTPIRSKEVVNAVIKSASIDKRNNKVYYFLLKEDNTTGFADVNNKSLKLAKLD